MVALGGALGSVCRFILGQALNRNELPWGTLLANLLGCALIGALSVRAQALPSYAWPLLATGFLGGLTTFSSYTLESHTLLESRAFTAFALYWLGSAALGLLVLHLSARLSASL